MYTPLCVFCLVVGIVQARGIPNVWCMQLHDLQNAWCVAYIVLVRGTPRCWACGNQARPNALVAAYLVLARVGQGCYCASMCGLATYFGHRVDGVCVAPPPWMDESVYLHVLYIHMKKKRNNIDHSHRTTSNITRIVVSRCSSRGICGERDRKSSSGSGRGCNGMVVLVDE